MDEKQLFPKAIESTLHCRVSDATATAVLLSALGQGATETTRQYEEARDDAPAVLEAIARQLKVVIETLELLGVELKPLHHLDKEIIDLLDGRKSPLLKASAKKASRTPVAGQELQHLAVGCLEVLTAKAGYTESRAAKDIARELNAQHLRPQRGYGLHRAASITANSVKGWRAERHKELAELRERFASLPAIPTNEAPARLRGVVLEYVRTGAVNFLKM